MDVLGIPVANSMVSRWREWLMPDEQPFLVPYGEANRLGFDDDRDRVTAELRDSFQLYGLRADQAVCWLSRSDSRQLSAEVRRVQPSPHLWPNHDATDLTRTIKRVENRRRASRHRDVGNRVWSRADDALPGARELAGTFPTGSGPNCFGAVMGAAGVGGAASSWMQRGAFEQWLVDATRAGGADD